MGDDPYEYTVRYQELDALGQPCGYEYYEWSGGFTRIVDHDEAQAVARDWREDLEGAHVGDVEVVRRPRSEWEPVASAGLEETERRDA